MKENQIKQWVINEMIVGKWYKWKEENIQSVKNIISELQDIELTFNSDYTKLKKTIWKNNKPI